jgi:hypothetical protein
VRQGQRETLATLGLALGLVASGVPAAEAKPKAGASSPAPTKAAPQPAPAWEGRAGEFHMRLSRDELTVRRGAAGPVVLSLAEEFAEQTKTAETDAADSASALVDAAMDEMPMIAETSLTAEVASWVGPLLTLTETVQGMTPGAAHPYAAVNFRVVDLRRADAVPTLTTYFDEGALRTALLGDAVVRRHLPSGKAKTVDAALPTLDSVLAAIDGAGDEDCKYRFSRELLSHFAFLAVRDAGKPGAQVAVRLGMSHGCEAARGSFTQLGLWLPLAALKPGAKDLAAWLDQAASGKGGLLLGGKARPQLPVAAFAWEKDVSARAKAPTSAAPTPPPTAAAAP